MTHDDYDCGAMGGMNEWQGKLKYPEKTGRPVTNRLSYGMAKGGQLLCNLGKPDGF
jgi:hypothetical protein